MSASRNTSKRVGTRSGFDEEVAFEDPWNSDGDVESDDNHVSTPLPAIEEETGRRKRGPLVPYTEEELDSMVWPILHRHFCGITKHFGLGEASRRESGYAGWSAVQRVCSISTVSRQCF